MPGLSQVVLLITVGLVAPPANSGPGGMPPGFQVAARPKDQVLAPGQEYRAALPPLPPRPGKVLLLGFHAVALAPREAGGYYLLAVGFNGTALGATPGGEARLVGRDGALEIRGDPESRTARLFHDNALLLMYAPDVDRADAMAAGGRGATFLFDVSDLVRGGMANELIFHNTRGAGAGPPVQVAVQDVQVGWADRSALPAPPSEVQQRGPIGMAAESEGLRLLQGRGGGFALRAGEGPQLLVETGLGTSRTAPPDLRADDSAGGGSARLEIEPFGPRGFRVTAGWPGLQLLRTVELRDARAVWSEEWVNKGDKVIGVPFHHRVFLDRGPAQFWLSGDGGAAWLESCAANPTMFVGPRPRPGSGFGITAETDWLRLLMGLKAYGGLGEIYSETLALAPGSRVSFTWTIDPVRDGGYWTFINALRRRWRVNGACATRPLFWSYSQAPGAATLEERARRSLGHLGPIFVGKGPWLRLEFDADQVKARSYPVLPPGAPRTPGPCPLLDVGAYLSRQGREPVWRQFATELVALKRACPEALPVQWTHTATEVVYRPTQERWPYVADVILRPDAQPFEVAQYDRSWLGERAKDGWGVLYYVPRPGSALLADILADLRRSMDRCGSDGVYVDEFSWANRTRGYSRYDYSRWDGYSADLDRHGRVLRLKSDNAFVTGPSQVQIAGEALRWGKAFFANGGAALRSGNDLVISRFVEAGNGLNTLSDAHLNQVPLVLGNFGDLTTRSGVLAVVKDCLARGCVYSPTAVNLLLEGSDNFVCKLYPITVREIGPGFVLGEERLITTDSGRHRWPGRAASVRVYRYNSRGNLLGRDPVTRVDANEAYPIEVPPQGLVIAEVVEQR